MADPVVLLFAPASSLGAPLRDRLTALGLPCDLVDSSGPPRGWLDSGSDVILVVETGGFSSPVSHIVSRRGGTRMEHVPLVVFGSRPPLGSGEVDEVIPATADDTTLAERLKVWARWGRLAAQVRQIEGRAREAGEIDSVSGLPGLRAFHERLECEVKRSERYGSSLGLLLGDIEKMREINERCGHRTGDHVLREVGQMLRRAVRDVDLVARCEADTFGIILPESGALAVDHVRTRLRTLIASLIFRGESPSGSPLPLLKVTMHFGQAILADTEIRGKSSLLAAAERSLEQERGARTNPEVPAL